MSHGKRFNIGKAASLNGQRRWALNHHRRRLTLATSVQPVVELLNVVLHKVEQKAHVVGSLGLKTLEFLLDLENIFFVYESLSSFISFRLYLYREK